MGSVIFSFVAGSPNCVSRDTIAALGYEKVAPAPGTHQRRPESPRRSLVAIRFYIDADIIGLGKLLVQVRPDVTYAGDPGRLGMQAWTSNPTPPEQ